MDALNELLTQIELAIVETPKTPKDAIKLEGMKMYTEYALEICTAKLTNKSTESGREGILRAKAIFEKIEKLKFNTQEN